MANIELYDILRDLVIIFSMATLVVIFFYRANLPPIVGFIITGIVCRQLGLIQHEENIELLGEIGMIMLMFSLGIELSMKKIRDLGKFLLIGGMLQVCITVFLVALVCRAFGLPIGKSIFIGMLISLSSTALVVRYMADRGEVNSLHGKTCFSILIFQDLIIVPMVLLAPSLVGEAGFDAMVMAEQVVIGVLFLGAAILATRYVVPWILDQVVKTRNREAFLMTVMLLCAGTTWATGSLGLSATLGAFIAGLVISESDYSLQAFSEILPFREIFNSLFFVSVGMLFNPAILFESPIIVLACVIGVILLKMIVTTMVTFFYGYSLRVATLSGLSLSQIGEFSFVLAAVGVGVVFTTTDQTLFLALAIGTMLATPFVRFLWAPLAATLNRSFPEAWSQGYLLTDLNDTFLELEDHVIVIGFGPNGRQLVKVLSEVNIPYVILEMNPETVRKEQALGHRIIYGDAARPEVLEKAQIRKAKMVVVAIPDISGTRRIVYLVKNANADVYILVRTSFYKELPELKNLGAHEVVSQEFETSIKMFSHALEFYEIPKDTIDGFINITRSERSKLIHAESEARS